ncbi:MAG: PilW family protein [Parahaliea sp.]
MQSKGREAGLSLVELMVALAIGAFLVLGAVSIFVGNRSASDLETSLARLQENGRFALDLMTEDILNSQYLGCNTGDVMLYNMADDPNLPTFANRLEGVFAYEKLGDGSWKTKPAMPAQMTAGTSSIADSARNMTDALSVRSSRSLGNAQLTAKILPGATELRLDSNPDCRIETGSRMVVTGCQLTAHMFEVPVAPSCTPATAGNPVTLSLAGSGVNAITSFNTSYGDDDVSDGDDGADVLITKRVFWFVADTGRQYRNVPVYALFREVNGQREEMIEGVENMQIMFGQRIAGTDNLRYVRPADSDLNANLDNYDGLNTVRIALLVQSYDSVKSMHNPDDKTYRLLNADIGPADHTSGNVLREVFTTTVLLRNAPEV